MTRPIRCCLLLAATALLLAGSGCTIALKGGVHAFDNDGLERAREDPTIDVWEIEAGVREFAEGRTDLAGAISIVDPPINTEFIDLRATQRYHWRRARFVSPYVGGGVGWYRWSARRTVLVPGCTINGLPCTGREEETLSSGLYPHVVAGINFTVRPGFDIVLENRYDFAKDDNDIEFDAYQATAGVRFRLGG